jgi:hypothetical protein
MKFEDPSRSKRSLVSLRGVIEEARALGIRLDAKTVSLLYRGWVEAFRPSRFLRFDLVVAPKDSVMLTIGLLPVGMIRRWN